MKKILIQTSLLLCLGACTTNSFALSDDFFATGEDLEFLFETNSDFALEEIEYELRKFVLYRKLEDLLLDFDDEFPGVSQ